MVMEMIADSGLLRALDIVEVNPTLDVQNNYGGARDGAGLVSPGDEDSVGALRARTSRPRNPNHTLKEKTMRMLENDSDPGCCGGVWSNHRAGTGAAQEPARDSEGDDRRRQHHHRVRPSVDEGPKDHGRSWCPLAKSGGRAPTRQRRSRPTRSSRLRGPSCPRAVHALHAAGAGRLAVDREQADGPVGDGIRPEAGPGTGSAQEDRDAGTGRAADDQRRQEPRRGWVAENRLGEHGARPLRSP